MEEVPLHEFGALRENDILFIDSSHVLKTGSDVQFLFLEILPRINKGVIVHLHDIFLAVEYPQDWVINKKYFWTEQYLLQAFLSFNESFEVIWAGHYMHLDYSAQLKNAFSSYDSIHGPGSFWIRKIK